MKANSKTKKKPGQWNLKTKLNEIPLEKLARENRFYKRRPQKITAENFLIGFFLMVFSSHGNSFSNWAMKIGILIGDTLSKQAIWKRMHEEQIHFLKKVLEWQ